MKRIHCHVVTYRTGAEVLSDIGGVGSTSYALNVINAANTIDLFTVMGSGAATFSSSVQTGGNIRTLMTGTTGVPSIYAENNVGSINQIRVFGTSAAGTLFGVTRAGWSSIDTNNGLGLLFGTTDNAPIVIGTSNTERMRITSGGNVGIGTTSPQASLDVRGSGNTSLNSRGNLFVSSGGTASQSAGTGGQISFGSWLNGDLSHPYPLAVIKGVTESSTSNMNNGALIFGTMDSNTAVQERMRITSGGNVGIGTSSPNARLNIAGGDFRLNGVNANSRFIVYENYSNSAVGVSLFNNSGTEVISLNGNAGNINCTGSITTGAPTNGTAQPWKLGDARSGGISTDSYIIVSVNGQTYSIPALQGLP